MKIWYLEHHTFFTGGDQSKEGEISFPKLHSSEVVPVSFKPRASGSHISDLHQHTTLPPSEVSVTRSMCCHKVSEDHMDVSDCQNYPRLSQYKGLTVFSSYIQQNYIFPKILPNSCLTKPISTSHLQIICSGRLLLNKINFHYKLKSIIYLKSNFLRTIFQHVDCKEILKFGF